MTVSVFTPTHDTRFLMDAYRSLLGQTTLDTWEWVIVPNGGASIPFEIRSDERVKVVPAPDDLPGIGALKRFACQQATGDILVELDHDDWLMPTALLDVAAAAAAQPQAALIYSDYAYIDAEGNPSPFQYQGRWNYSSELAYGKMYHRCHSQAATPENVAVIWYAPNHIRAFPRWAYDAAGGYDPAFTILDDQDLMCRLFLQGPFHHIDAMLYLQRMHGGNTQVDTAKNAEIQRLTTRIYRERIEGMTRAYVDRLLTAARAGG